MLVDGGHHAGHLRIIDAVWPALDGHEIAMVAENDGLVDLAPGRGISPTRLLFLGEICGLERGKFGQFLRRVAPVRRDVANWVMADKCSLDSPVHPLEAEDCKKLR